MHKDLCDDAELSEASNGFGVHYRKVGRQLNAGHQVQGASKLIGAPLGPGAARRGASRVHVAAWLEPQSGKIRFSHRGSEQVLAID